MPKQPEYLTTVSDDTAMTRDEFLKLLSRFKHHRSIKFGFSKKHTEDILEFRRKTGSRVPANNNLYDVPVTWNTEVTYVAN